MPLRVSGRLRHLNPQAVFGTALQTGRLKLHFSRTLLRDDYKAPGVILGLAVGPSHITGKDFDCY